MASADEAGSIPLTVQHNWDRFVDLIFWYDGILVTGEIFLSDGNGDEGVDELYQLQHWTPARGDLLLSREEEDEEEGKLGCSIKLTANGLEVYHHSRVMYSASARERDFIREQILKVYEDNDIVALSPRSNCSGEAQAVRSDWTT